MKKWLYATSVYFVTALSRCVSSVEYYPGTWKPITCHPPTCSKGFVPKGKDAYSRIINNHNHNTTNQTQYNLNNKVLKERGW